MNWGSEAQTAGHAPAGLLEHSDQSAPPNLTTQLENTMNANEYHTMFTAFLDDAEKAFRVNPRAAYARLRQLWRENMAENNGQPGQAGPELNAYDTAADDFRSGALK